MAKKEEELSWLEIFLMARRLWRAIMAKAKESIITIAVREAATKRNKFPPPPKGKKDDDGPAGLY